MNCRIEVLGVMGYWGSQKSCRNVDLSLRFLDDAQPHEDTDHDTECHDQECQPNNGHQDGVLGTAAVLTIIAPVAKMEGFGGHGIREGVPPGH